MKIGALVPVRLASERLPGKALLEIQSRPVIGHLLDRILKSRFIADASDIVVCTTQEETDDRLAEAVTELGFSIFRGDTDNIIDRFDHAISAHGFDAVIQANGDNPLSATEYMDLTMERLLTDPSLDIVTVDGLPLGVATVSFTSVAMRRVARACRTQKNDTGFIYYFTRSGLCNHLKIEPVSPDHVHETARLTLDYEVDLELFKRIFEALYRPGETILLQHVIAFLRAQPELVEINRHVEQEYWRRTAEKMHLCFVDGNGSISTIQH